ncbi:unnamed protein product [Acanthosepion pharaonis]|uniref:Uncharacterized protein n=1 Tax=Acanthosepion pharaonis TaxID=158019 RepID=A0A812DXP9_ACAPH|nr:unnamed protein product [Sepia pharaonis]
MLLPTYYRRIISADTGVKVTENDELVCARHGRYDVLPILVESVFHLVKVSHSGDVRADHCDEILPGEWEAAGYQATIDPFEQAANILSRVPTETEVHSFTPIQILRKRQFYILWFICVLNGQSILFIAGLYKAYGQTFIHDDHFLAVVGSISAIGNTLGRALWGIVADKIGEKISLLILAILLTALQCLMNLSETIGRYYFLFIVFFIFLTGTGTYAILSSATFKCFGPKYYSTNFGLIFTSQVRRSVTILFFLQRLNCKRC